MSEFPTPPAGQRALRFVRDEEFSDDYHEDYGAFSGNLYVARIYSEDAAGEGINWVWSLHDILLQCPDVIMGGRAPTFDEVKQTVRKQS